LNKLPYHRMPKRKGTGRDATKKGKASELQSDGLSEDECLGVKVNINCLLRANPLLCMWRMRAFAS